MIIARIKKYVVRVVPVAFAVITLFTARADAGFVQIPMPDATYIGQTTLLPVSGLDFDAVSSLSSGGFTVSFDTPLVTLTVPTRLEQLGLATRRRKLYAAGPLDERRDVVDHHPERSGWSLRIGGPAQHTSRFKHARIILSRGKSHRRDSAGR